MANVQHTQRKFYALRSGSQFVSNRGDKRSRFLAVRFIPCGIQFLITRSLNKTKPVSDFQNQGMGWALAILSCKGVIASFGIEFCSGSLAPFWKKPHWLICEAMARLIPISLWLQGMMSVCGRANAIYQSTRVRYARN